jgi:hypothetical protein
VRIVSLNCWVGRVSDPLLKFLPDIDADVYCLQEVTWALLEEAPTRAQFRYRHKPEIKLHYTNLYDKFCELLPDHHGVFYPAAEIRCVR